MIKWQRILGSPDIPSEFKGNFKHLYLEMGWFGVLSGSSLAFLSIFAVRLGANSFQIGLLGAMPAVVNLLFAIPAGQWLQNRAIGKAVFWTSVLYRFGYLFLIPLPSLFASDQQIWILIALALLMGVPGTALAVGFNSLFADAVPVPWRAHVAGTRNIVLAIVYVTTSIVSGAILHRMPFPQGYQVVFGIGFLGAAMSSFHLFFIRTLEHEHVLVALELKQSSKSILEGGRYWFIQLRQKLAGASVWKSPFRKTLVVLLFFHTAQFLVTPIFPIFFVNVLNLNDQQIGMGTAAFYLTVLLGSTQLARVSQRWGNHRVTGIGVTLMSLYPILLAISTTFGQYLVVSLVGGISWALVGGALANYLLDRMPGSDRPAYLAWYNIILNGAILAGSLIGPVAAQQLGLVGALILFGILRLISGLAILKWG
jgi:MFS family permease